MRINLAQKTTRLFVRHKFKSFAGLEIKTRFNQLIKDKKTKQNGRDYY